MTKDDIVNDFYSVAVSVINEYEDKKPFPENEIEKIWLNSCYRAVDIDGHRHNDNHLPSAVLITDVWDFVSIDNRTSLEQDNHPFYQAWLEVSGN